MTAQLQEEAAQASGSNAWSAPDIAPNPAHADAAEIDSARPADAGGLESLKGFFRRHERLFVLTGAGCSTDSGIPDYRDASGAWKRPQPINFQAFMGDAAMRRRYWARSVVGWRRMGQAAPNNAHLALAQLERVGRVELLLTQNVDRLHQAAGSSRVIDLHGRIDQVRCMACERRSPREAFQGKLLQLNPSWADLEAETAPDGDADLVGFDFSGFAVPPCPDCGGIIKPDVVFFGESVPRDRVVNAMSRLERSDAVIVVGSSLMVYSGYRFVQAAVQAGKPVAAINVGSTRADALLEFKLERRCAAALAFLLDGSWAVTPEPVSPS